MAVYYLEGDYKLHDTREVNKGKALSLWLRANYAQIHLPVTHQCNDEDEFWDLYTPLGTQ